MQIKKIINYRFRNENGFTLIEVIAVLVILSIIAVVVISRGGSSAEATLKSSAEALKGHIRFAQMKALNSDAPACDASVSMTISGTSYSMFTITGPLITPGTPNCTPVPAILPGAQSSSVNLPTGITITITATPATSTFSFDRWGRPHSNADGTGTSSTILLTLKYVGLPDEEITITQNTGYVP